SMYSAGGDEALIDRLRGGSDFRTGEWQGYQGQDFVAVVDLLTPRNITAIETGFIQDTRSWIILPKYVDFYVSTDNIHFKKVAHLTHSIADNDYKSQIYHFEQQLDNCQAQYVKVYAKYYGPLPKWHLGYGGESYLFVDEIDVKTKD
ncbi:MAG: discoidin domain-containing protein, partial [Bacteroidales bacterium]|nr:discoidin domain-containing protein [Bacteroidales bacterium]